MTRVLHYYAHPNHRHSHANSAMINAAAGVSNITTVDLYGEYPRYDIAPAREQARLLDHDVILFQFPVFWYSAPALVKEWIDLVLAHGFAYGDGAQKLAGKTMMLAVTVAGSEHAYSAEGYQSYPLRTFLTPFEQTARLCGMQFLAPYVLYSALHADINEHAAGFKRLLVALRDDQLDTERAIKVDVLTADSLPLLKETTR